MKDFKKKWEIDNNWQLIFPLLGIILSILSGYRITLKLLNHKNILLQTIATTIFAYILLRISVFVIHKLEKKWVVRQKWELIRIFIVFAITGSSSVFIGRPFIKWLGINPQNFNPLIYWILFIVISLVLYQIILLILGWISGQFHFFWEFEKRFLKRIGLGKFLN